MVGSIPAGIFAAGIVLFLPIGMAGYHLSRNRMLFFSAALFITLAVGVHLMPYFPDLSQIISSFTSFKNNLPFPCLTLLHEVEWDGHAGSEVEGSNPGRTWHWKNNEKTFCGFQKLGRSDALDLLNGSWIAVAGDSEARYVVLYLLDLLLESTDYIRGSLFKRHSNYQFVLGERGFKVDFIWAPFAVNLTWFLGEIRRGGAYPDVIVMGAGLWHMLYVSNGSQYGEGLRRVRNEVDSLLPLKSSDSFGGDYGGPHIFWIGLPTLVNSMLNTEAKRQRMTREMWVSYVEELERSRLLRDQGGPLLLLDIGGLSRDCGSNCTDDGMHYKGVVYEAAVQIMLNALVIESQQRPIAG